MAKLSAQAFSLLIVITIHLHLFIGEAKTFSITNNCNFEVWPSIVNISAGGYVAESGFALLQGESTVVAVAVQNGWTGHVWGRTLCSTNKSTGKFSCQTGDCDSGKVECITGPASPATLAEFGLGIEATDFYDVSVVDGYNLPVMVAPLVEGGDGCGITGCVFDLVGSCPAELRMIGNNGSVIGCESACHKFRTDKYCCNNATTDCKHSDPLSLTFKKACPRAYSDNPYDRNATRFATPICWGEPSRRSNGPCP